MHTLYPYPTKSVFHGKDAPLVQVHDTPPPGFKAPAVYQTVPWLASLPQRSKEALATPLLSPQALTIAKALATVPRSDMRTLAEVQHILLTYNNLLRKGGIRPTKALKEGKAYCTSLNIDDTLQWLKRHHKAYAESGDTWMLTLDIPAPSHIRKVKTGWLVMQGLLGSVPSLTDAAVRLAIYRSAKATNLHAALLHLLVQLGRAAPPSQSKPDFVPYTAMKTQIDMATAAGATTASIAQDLADRLIQAGVIRDMDHLTRHWPDPDSSYDWDREDELRYAELDKFRLFNLMHDKRRGRPVTAKGEAAAARAERAERARTGPRVTFTTPPEPPERLPTHIPQHLDVQLDTTAKPLPSQLAQPTQTNTTQAEIDFYAAYEARQADLKLIIDDPHATPQAGAQALAEWAKPRPRYVPTEPFDPEKPIRINPNVHLPIVGYDDDAAIRLYEGRQATIEDLRILGPWAVANDGYGPLIDEDFTNLVEAHEPTANLLNAGDKLGIRARNWGSGSNLVASVFGTYCSATNEFCPDLQTCQFWPKDF